MPQKPKLWYFVEKEKHFCMKKIIMETRNSKMLTAFLYLGTVFSYTGDFEHNNEQIVGKVLKALNVLLMNCKCKLKPKTLCQLFDSFVGSILNYAAEISGFSKSKDIERIHLQFCKSILKVRKSTINATVYAELGRYPLYITRHVQIVKYWFKVINTNNILLKKVYDFAKQDCLKGLNNWVPYVCRSLNENGFSYVWENPFLLISNLLYLFLEGGYQTTSSKRIRPKLKSHHL